jgi:outer membrane protein TolC
MKRYCLALVGCCALAWSVQAQDIDSLLHCIERNNKQLQALQKDNEAAVEEIKSENTAGDLSLEYSPFFRRGTDGMASSELVVTQGFDFPTLYAARRKAAESRGEALAWSYRSARRDILWQAKSLCLDLVYLNRAATLLEKRRMNSEKLLALYEKRLADGDATAIEVNKIKMDQMSIAAEQAQMETTRQNTLHALAALNGNVPFDFGGGTDYPAVPVGSDEALYERMMRSDLALRGAEAETESTAQELNVSKQNLLPKLEIGYRRNTETGEASHGFLVGGSLSLFPNRRKVKVARARQLSARLKQDEARVQAEQRARAKVKELRQLETAVAAYDTRLMHQTLEALRKSVEGGQISLTDYYVEADAVYRNLQTALQLERQYQGVAAEIGKDEL